jgi:putative toxin-antitoxin system antitoxin component (TIGR02293 family)
VSSLPFFNFSNAGRKRGSAGLCSGVPVARIFELAKVLGLSRGTLFACLGISRASVDRRVQACLPLSADEAERVLGVESLIGQVQAMVKDGETGKAAGFDSARWLACWIRQPLPALGGRLPASYLHTLDGQRLVRKMLDMIASGAYA